MRQYPSVEVGFPCVANHPQEGTPVVWVGLAERAGLEGWVEVAELVALEEWVEVEEVVEVVEVVDLEGQVQAEE